MDVTAQICSNLVNDASIDSQQDPDEPTRIKFKDWGFKVDRLFEVAYRFYKRNESKAFHPTFDERNQMNALILQARYGNFDSNKAPDIGMLDLVGKNRCHQWSLLKGMSKMEAMSKFICTLDNICPFFKAHAEAVKLSSGIQLELNIEDNRKDLTNSLNGSSSNERQEQSEQLKAIRTSLRRQTYDQFKGYAEKQYPNDLSKQKYLIATLQEQYFQQYISQMHPELVVSGDNSSMPSPSQSNKSSETSNDLTTSFASQENSLANGSQMQSNIKQPTPVSEMAQPNNSHSHSNNSEQNLVPENDTLMNKETNSLSNNLNPEVQQSSTYSPQLSIGQNNTTPMNQNPTNANTQADLDMKDLYLNQTKQQYPIPANETYEVKPDPPLQNIGTFESYPAPVPIKSVANQQNSQHSANFTINMFNPNMENTRAQTSSSLHNPSLNPEIQQSQQYSQNQQHEQVSPSLPGPPSVSIPTATNTYKSPSTPPILQSNPPLPDLPPVETFNYPSNLQQEFSEPSPQMMSFSLPGSNFENQSVVQPEYGEGSSCASSCGTESPLQQSMSYGPMEPATIWTKKGVSEFKDSLIDDKHGGAYIVKQGTLLTIQVPTYPDGKYIYWEFVTEDYDIGFGLDFIYENNLEKPLALKIFEEADEDDDEDVEELNAGDDSGFDLESANDPNKLTTDYSLSLERRRAEKFARKANSLSIVPTYRRDSHEEVYVGRHKYPGQGYYLLKFDNTYSVLRSKSLFFRICYFM